MRGAPWILFWIVPSRGSALWSWPFWWLAACMPFIASWNNRPTELHQPGLAGFFYACAKNILKHEIVPTLRRGNALFCRSCGVLGLRHDAGASQAAFPRWSMGMIKVGLTQNRPSGVKAPRRTCVYCLRHFALLEHFCVSPKNPLDTP